MSQNGILASIGAGLYDPARGLVKYANQIDRRIRAVLAD